MGEVDDPRAVGEPVNKVARDVKREARLADPAGTGECDDAGLEEKFRHVLDEIATTDERGKGRRKIPQLGIQRLGTREDHFDVRVRHLKQPFGIREALESVDAEIHQTGVFLGAPGGVVFGQGRGDGRRRDHLTAVRDRHHSTTLVEGGAEEVAIALLGPTRMDPHSHAEAVHGTEVLATESSLGFNRRLNGGGGVLEVRDDSVAGVLQQRTPVALDRRSQDVVVAMKRLRHGGG